MMNTVAKKKKPVEPMKQPFGSMPLGQKPMPKPPSAPNPAYPVPAAPKPIAQQPQPKPQPPAQPPTPPPTSNVAPFLNRPPPRIPQTDPRNAVVGVPTKPTSGPLPGPKAPPAPAAPPVDEAAKARAIEMATRKAKDKLREQSIANTGPDTSVAGVDQATADLISQMIAGGGKADTAEEEKLIRDMFESQLSNQLAGQRARSGRLGFAASGANAAMEGDLRRQGSQQALQDILGLRRGEDQRSIDNAFKGVGAEYDTVRGSTRDQAIIDALTKEFGDGVNPEDVPPMPGTQPTAEQQAAAKAEASYQKQEDAGMNADVYAGKNVDGKITDATGYTYNVEAGKRSENDMATKRVSVGGQTYQVFIDSKQSVSGKKPVEYAVPVKG